ncbi:hypothetical protein [Paeniglutamicibacter sp.]|uniref:hypothetical protein n=1 Tax=Paeniglutamicibacter sp. TaxID=1934391 RepID=UPI003988F455
MRISIGPQTFTKPTGNTEFAMKFDANASHLWEIDPVTQGLGSAIVCVWEFPNTGIAPISVSPPSLGLVMSISPDGIVLSHFKWTMPVEPYAEALDVGNGWTRQEKDEHATKYY